VNARRQGRALDAALWGVAALVAYFSLQNVTAFAVQHGTPLRTAVVLAPMVDIALVAALVADGVLSRGGVVSTGWGTLLRWFAGVATLTFNVWESVARQDIAAVVLHAVPPLLLILLAEAAPQYRRQFAALAETAGEQNCSPAPVPVVAERNATLLAVPERGTQEHGPVPEEQAPVPGVPAGRPPVPVAVPPLVPQPVLAAQGVPEPADEEHGPVPGDAEDLDKSANLARWVEAGNKPTVRAVKERYGVGTATAQALIKEHRSRNALEGGYL
jgi:hypothetical protein